MCTQLRRILLSCCLLIGGLCILAIDGVGQNYGNVITFSNLSGEDALVKIIGPVRGVVLVENGSERSVRVPAGEYYILVRYCEPRGYCSYSRGDAFSVDETPTQYSEISISLHKVVNGNYGTRPSSSTEFDGN